MRPLTAVPYREAAQHRMPAGSCTQDGVRAPHGSDVLTSNRMAMLL